MRSLRDLQQQFADAVFAADGGFPAFATTGRASPEERIGIYRRAVFANYGNALAATYPVVQKLVGAPFFRAAVDGFVRASPSCSSDLNVYGEAFGDFLAAYAPAADLPYLPDVARLEWAIDEANRAEDPASTPDLVLAALAIVPADRLPAIRLRLAASCRFVVSDYPILRIWEVNQSHHDGDDRVQLDESADRLLVRRGARGVVLERPISGEFEWLTALAAGATLADAIEAAQGSHASFDLGDAMRTHIGSGTLAAIARDGRQE